LANHGAAIVGASLLVRGPLWCGDRESHEKAAEIRPFYDRHYFSRLGGGAVGVSSLLADNPEALEIYVADEPFAPDSSG
jgi:hypothetical protein